MEELKKLLLQTDDEYLTGLSNKGTVKRAYKDLEQEEPEAVWEEEGAEVRLKEAVCRIRVPLGSSVCSCPSRSVCRHLIAAILYLKRELAEGEGTVRETDQETAEEKISEKQMEEGEDPAAILEQELLAIPLEKLRKACRSKGYRVFLEHMEAGELPKLESGSVITVRLPWDGTVVKLLSPLAYASCTCHSRELCTHKAQAVLIFQLQKGAVSPEQLKAGNEGGGEWDLEELSQAAQAMKEGIRIQLLTGLSRLSPEASESMERLAVISHGAGLPSFESEFRSAAFEYRRYFERSAAFHEEILLGRLLALYRKACLLEQTREADELGALAGSFRETYHPAPRLHLTAIGERSFTSKNGYQGETYYFLETDQRRFYTWTDARPTFYEGVRRRPAGNQELSQAPWGLNVSRARMMELEFYLTQAKATKDGRLSVSQETKSEIAGQRQLGKKEIREMIVWDYRELLEKLASGDHEPLVLAGAVSCREGSFDPVGQRFSMEICDRNGRSLSVAVTYSREEKFIIHALERLSARLKKQEQRGMVFFGIPYLEKGRLCLYPIEYFGAEMFRQGTEKPWEDTSWKEEAQEGEFGKLKQESVRVLEDFLLEIRRTLADLFQSGLKSAGEEILSRLSELCEESGELGLHGAKKELTLLYESLEGRRHQIRPDFGPGIAAWARLSEYLEICLKKTALDQAMIGLGTVS